MESFNYENVTAILPAQDGSCLFAQSRWVKRLIPYSSDPPRVELNGSMIVRRMNFVPSHDNEERYVQICSGGNWYRGYDPQARQPEFHDGLHGKYPNTRANHMILKWSGYSDGPCVYENVKGRRWHSLGGLRFYTPRGARLREGHTLGAMRIGLHAVPDTQTSVSGTSVILSAGIFRVGADRYCVCARRFDARTGKFEGTTDIEVITLGPEVWPHIVATRAGTLAVYSYPDDTIEKAVKSEYEWRVEILSDLTTRVPPAWYPDLRFGDSLDDDLRASILHDRAAWIGSDCALYCRTAETNKLRRFRPNGRRKVRGCAFSPDGQTLWAFDSACIFRVDVDP